MFFILLFISFVFSSYTSSVVVVYLFIYVTFSAQVYFVVYETLYIRNSVHHFVVTTLCGDFKLHVLDNISGTLKVYTLCLLSIFMLLLLLLVVVVVVVYVKIQHENLSVYVFVKLYQYYRSRYRLR